MSEIKIERQLARSAVEALGVFDWPVWEKAPSVFEWHYDTQESCYFLTGEVVVTPQHGEPVVMGTGDFVTFPAGLSCTWQVRQALKKHYCFG
ncbi:MAG: cupin domain-containing protein [Pseudomonadota bacterium]|nr:cupin domain-containing protein [Pseudomonadota bacterium]